MTITITVQKNEFAPIHAGLQAFYLSVDESYLQPGVKLFFREQLASGALTGRSIECTITTVLRRKDSRMINPDCCVIGFHTDRSDREQIVSQTQLANILDRAVESVGHARPEGQYYRHSRFSQKAQKPLISRAALD